MSESDIARPIDPTIHKLIEAYLLGYFRAADVVLLACRQVAACGAEYAHSTFSGTNFETVTLDRVATPWRATWAGVSWHTRAVIYWIDDGPTTP